MIIFLLSYSFFVFTMDFEFDYLENNSEQNIEPLQNMFCLLNDNDINVLSDIKDRLNNSLKKTRKVYICRRRHCEKVATYGYSYDSHKVRCSLHKTSAMKEK